MVWVGSQALREPVDDHLPRRILVVRVNVFQAAFFGGEDAQGLSFDAVAPNAAFGIVGGDGSVMLAVDDQQRLCEVVHRVDQRPLLDGVRTPPPWCPCP
jgi:hypothetical protein